MQHFPVYGVDMGHQDDISPERLRADLRRFAQLILRLDEEGRLLEGSPRVMKMMGDLRSKLFAWEVRGARDLGPEDESEAEPLSEAERIVDEAIRRSRKAGEEWSRAGDWSPDPDA
jgi:PAS domain-containing protein